MDKSQIGWVLSHGETLEELVLNDCRIAHYMSFASTCPPGLLTYLSLGWIDPNCLHLNKIRWLSVFQQIESRLSKLNVFRFVSGTALNFDDGKIPDEALYVDRYITYSHPRIDWEHREDITDPNCVWPQRDSHLMRVEFKAYQHLMTVVKARQGKWLELKRLQELA
jgi:hypothetical protein